jgi:hypothetical protein
VGCFDEPRRFRIVGQGFADLTDRDLEHRVADEGVGPDGANQALLRDELTRTRQQMLEHRERLRAQLDDLGAPPQALVDRVEVERSKTNSTVVGHGVPRVTEDLPWRYD